MSYFIPNGTKIPSDSINNHIKNNNNLSPNSLLLSQYSSTNDVSNPVAGMIIFNTTSKILNFYNGTNWEETISPWTQQGSKLVGTGYAGSPLQGFSVALSKDGNTLAIGGYADNSNIGATWIFTRNSGVWTQQGSKLVGTGNTGNARQGFSVSLSLDGNTLAVGGYGDNSNVGAVWIFTRSAGVWTQQGSKLVGTGNIGSSRQGSAVSLSTDGNTLAVGGPVDNVNTGATWIFTRSAGVWTQQGSKLVGTGAVGAARQGGSISLSSDGNTLALGGFQDDGFVGAAWVFTRSAGVWTQQGSKLVGTGNIGSSLQGQSVSLSGDGNTLASGGPGNDNILGSVWIFTRSAGVWTQQGLNLTGTGYIGTEIYQGFSVALSSDGNVLIFGGQGDDTNIGATWTFTRSGTVWTQFEQKIIGNGYIDPPINQGFAISMSEDAKTLAVGGYTDNSNIGAVWIFTR
jgi:hypothetical protein